MTHPTSEGKVCAAAMKDQCTCGSRCVCVENQASSIRRKPERQRERGAVVWTARACIHGHRGCRCCHASGTATRHAVGKWTPVSIRIARQVQIATHIHEATRAHECRERTA